MVKQLASTFVLVALVAACGGGKKENTTPADETGGGGGEETDADATNSDMITAEQADEIQRMLDRKQRIVSRCLADAVDAKELPRNSRGKITLEIVISPGGRATTVKVIKSTLDSERVAECVIGHVREIQFPTLPKEYPTSYAYGFEAM